jgi:hypothetical protein
MFWHNAARTESAADIAPRINANNSSARAGKDARGYFSDSCRDACVAAKAITTVDALCCAQCFWPHAR